MTENPKPIQMDRGQEVKRDRTTPTSEGDISPRARLFIRLVDEAVLPTMALEGMQGGRATEEMRMAQEMQLRSIKRQAIIGGIGLKAFDLRVKMKIDEIKKQAERDEEVERVIREKKGALSPDWEIINKEFPNQYEEVDYDQQSRLGDVPPRNDAGGFEMKRRGW
jgi:hypothetical protein